MVLIMDKVWFLKVNAGLLVNFESLNFSSLTNIDIDYTNGNQKIYRQFIGSFYLLIKTAIF
jgi:hypothetical protein